MNDVGPFFLALYLCFTVRLKDFYFIFIFTLFLCI